MGGVRSALNRPEFSDFVAVLEGAARHGSRATKRPFPSDEPEPAMTEAIYRTSQIHARPERASVSARVLMLAYGTGTYVLFLGTFLYMIGFLTGAFVPKHIDSGPASERIPALLVNGAFLALFAVQHAVMARPAFKRWWTRVIPPVAERSTFVLFTCLILIGMIWNWRALPTVVWQVEGAGAVALYAVAAVGWLVVLISTFLIDHFELFGLRQAVAYFSGRTYASAKFTERSFYRYVRHPLMVGFLLAFWAAPVMTVGHLFFAVMCTVYIAVGVRLEEADLVRTHGDSYLDYRRRVRGFLPIPRRVGT